MSNDLIFTLLPFDPTRCSGEGTDLSLDLDDFSQYVMQLMPNMRIERRRMDDSESIKIYIQTEKFGRWNLGGYITSYSQLYVRGWPKRMAMELMLAYRRYVPFNIPLFAVIADLGQVHELTVDITPAELESLYPYPVSDE